VDEGAFVRGSSIVARRGGAERELPLPAGLDTPRVAAVLAALATAAALDAVPAAVGELRLPALRMASLGRVAGAELVDDGMAATPAKTLAALRGREAGSVVLVAGGELTSVGLPVHASAEERELLEAACAEARRVARLVVLFGPAARRLAPLLDPDRTFVAAGLSDAIAAAGRRLAGAQALLVSPMFPLAPDERRLIAPELLRLTARE
jgi:UDP-N-acetylmuramoylalanine-D-glutamate ligase